MGRSGISRHNGAMTESPLRDTRYHLREQELQALGGRDVVPEPARALPSIAAASWSRAVLPSGCADTPVAAGIGMATQIIHSISMIRWQFEHTATHFAISTAIRSGLNLSLLASLMPNDLLSGNHQDASRHVVIRHH